MRNIDLSKVQPIFLWLSKALKSGIPDDINEFKDLKGIEPLLGKCLKTLCGLRNRPKVISRQNCDLWWSVMVCGNNNYNAGAGYGYSRAVSERVCSEVTKYLMWYLMHVDKELMWKCQDMRVLLVLFSRRIYRSDQLISEFKEAKSLRDISFLSEGEWYEALLCVTSWKSSYIQGQIRRRRNAGLEGKHLPACG